MATISVDCEVGTKITCPVMGKIECIYDREQSNEPTLKHGRSGPQFLAVSRFAQEFMAATMAGIVFSFTGKIDGTCTLVKDGQMFKRRDLKDLSNVPAKWFQTANEINGHFIGFMPLEQGDPHLMCHPLRDGVEPTTRNLKNPESYDLSRVRALFLVDGSMQMKIVLTESLDGKTVEVVGPKLNNNSHGLEFHCVIPHGEIEIPKEQFLDLVSAVTEQTADTTETTETADVTERPILDEIKNWFLTSKMGPFLEGIVIHFENGQMFKLHREHLGLPWAKLPKEHEIIKAAQNPDHPLNKLYREEPDFPRLGDSRVGNFIPRLENLIVQ